MITDELNNMCKDCNCLNKDCEGTNEQSWTGCIYKGMKSGQKVKIINPYFNNRTGAFKGYLWNTGDYLIIMDDNKRILPFKKSEFEIVSELEQ